MLDVPTQKITKVARQRVGWSKMDSPFLQLAAVEVAIRTMILKVIMAE